MYTHLLVPLDATPASLANVQAAIELARQLQARITFIHADPRSDATADSNAKPLSPEAASGKAIGDANALLAKAAASATAMGVENTTCAVKNDRPAEAIVEAAQARGCDLIVMASRGFRGGIGGWLHSSQTERVLSRAPVALLVTRVESRQPLAPEERALAIIHDEHGSIAVVVQGMRDLARDAAAGAGARNCAALERMAAYLYEFPERVHHPKEEGYLLRLMRLWSPQSGPIIDEVEAQHRVERGYLDRVSTCLKELKENGGAEAAATLASAVELMAESMLQHIGYEERVLLPLARSTLTAEDWQQIADAFSTNDDPRYGDLSADQLRRIFVHIANSLAESAPTGRPAPVF